MPPVRRECNAHTGLGWRDSRNGVRERPWAGAPLHGKPCRPNGVNPTEARPDVAHRWTEAHAPIVEIDRDRKEVIACQT